MYKSAIQRRKKIRKIQFFSFLSILFLAGFFYFVIGGTDNYIREFFKGMLNPVPVFNHLMIEHNGIKKKLVSGQIFHIHPYDTLRLLETETSVPFNKGIRLFSKGFDVNALNNETIIAKLLPNQDIFHYYTYTIQIKYRNETIGEIEIDIYPSEDDWLKKADMIANPDERLEFLTIATRESGKSVRLKTKLADEYLKLKKWKEGASVIEDILIEKKDIGLMEKLADIYENLHQYNMVITTLRQILLKKPDDLGIRFRLARVLEKNGMKKEAIKEYTAVCPRLENDEKIACMKNVGYLFFEINQKKEALEWYIKAAKYDKNDPDLYYNIGSIYDELKKSKLAERYFRLAVDLRKDDIEGRLRLGQSLFTKGELKDAKKYVKEILEKSPHHLKALLLLSNIAEKEGNKDELIKIYRKILSRNPKNTTVLFNIGILEAERGNLKEGSNYLERLIKVDPKDIQARENLFDVYQRLKKEDMAFEQAVSLINLSPKKMTYYTYIFNYLLSRSEYIKLAKYMRKGVKENKTNLELRQYLIVSYLRQQKWELATKELKDALKLSPNDIELLFQLAEIKKKSGDFAQALELYNKILTISPGNERADEEYFRLRLMLLEKGK